MTTTITALIILLAFLCWLEIEEIMFRRSLDKITEDTIKLSEENTGLIIEKIKLKDKYYTQLNKTLSVEKKYLDLLQRVSPCERNKDEIERLWKIGRATDMIWEYFGVTGSAIRKALKRWWTKRVSLKDKLK